MAFSAFAECSYRVLARQTQRCSRRIQTEAISRNFNPDLSSWHQVLDIHPSKRITGPKMGSSGRPSFEIYLENDPPIFHERAQSVNKDLQQTAAGSNVFRDLARVTDFTEQEIKSFHRYALVVHRVSTQTSKGKIASMYAMVVAGNGNGLLGVGQGKHTLTPRAIDKAFAQAVRSMQPVERCENRTVWGEQTGQWCATDIKMWPRPPGFGLRTSPLIHQIAKAAGLHDLAAKVRGSRNAMNTVKCAVRMLQKRTHPIGLGDGLGHQGPRKAKGTGMRNATEIALLRGRTAVVI